MKLDSKTINEVGSRAALAASGPARVLVFGSYARDDAQDDSDLDLLVIEPGFSDKASEYMKIRSAIGRLGVGVDLLLFSEEEFARRSQVPGTVPYWAAREGKVIHDRRA
ncbi:MAG TPA: nucleotidyltransferase domain-containing protein [Rhodocyclaceae bacterium]|nr:nucleotidyltransferase domain-containing protein [Rhodocyclaceae bacterium]